MSDDFDLTQHLCDAATGALELFGVHLGTALGLYEALDRHGPLTPTELAARTGIHRRYAREWLEQQAVARFLEVVADADASGDPDTRSFALPAAHRGALVDPIDGDHVAPFGAMVAGIGAVLDDVVEAYRTGGGVPYARYGAHFRAGQGAINRPAFTSDLVKSWIPAVPGLADRLAGGARVADIGMGLGWSTIAIGAEWPAAEVVGLDTDEASVVDARANAARAGVDVTFAVATDEEGGGLATDAPFDVAFVLEALHDMSRPVDLLRSVGARLADDGVVIVVDENVAEGFTAPGDDVERMMYGWSIVHCLPAAMVEEDSAAIGTAIRPHTVREVAAEAGFSRCDVVDVDAGFFRVYRIAR